MRGARQAHLAGRDAEAALGELTASPPLTSKQVFILLLPLKEETQRFPKGQCLTDESISFTLQAVCDNKCHFLEWKQPVQMVSCLLSGGSALGRGVLSELTHCYTAALCCRGSELDAAAGLC